ncbi:glycosyltransferase family 1 protein [uncultured Cellulomonas sp.]|uniref:glycosyltransferase family 4 protein n=1 Tax=uncultured Cellulomonas sp. TaxID=189682 RepID=UPI0028E8EDCB|nr:glycosyltransferase family 1 protein [uncultured Cellulomonas sp.]
MTPENDRLRVALSMLTLVPGGMGGSETYARELVRGLAASDRVDATGFVARIGAGFCAPLPERVSTGVTGGHSTVDRVRTLAQAALHGRGLRAAMSGFDVVHVPFTAPVPRPPRGVPMVQTLFDVQHLDLPHLFSKAELLYRTRYYEGAARDAAAVVTISEFARRQIVEQVGVDADRVHVAHLGVDADAFTPHLGAREPFLLYPARGWAHKNHARLIEAVGLLRETRPDLRLVLTGGALDSLGTVPTWVDVRGLVPVDELRRLYRAASAMVFPSLYEGFGLPPLEAMASGCPVASSTAGSLPEICGDAAVLFDPTDPADIARGTLEAIDRTEQLQPLGLAQVRRFTWDRCLRVHEDAYAAAVRTA